MRVRQRLELLDRIGRELQARYSYPEIDQFLTAFAVSAPSNVTANSKWVYSKEALKDAPDEKLFRIAEELEIQIPALASLAQKPPKCWEDEGQFRLFISHLAVHKDKAHRLKATLAPYHISGFVAHEDIEPTKEWQAEIERALFTMDGMLAIHTTGFSQSVWTQQEIGVAIGRNVKVISLRMDEDPKGFISKHQAMLRRGRDATGIAEEIASIITSDPATKTRMAAVNEKHKKIEDDDIPF